MNAKESLSSGAKFGGSGDTSSPPSGEAGTTAPSNVSVNVAATVFVPTSRTFSVDVDAQYPYCTYKEH